MRSYDLTLILSTNLDKTSVDKTLDKIKKSITDSGGKISSVNEWGKKNLAYKIKKQDQGIYYHLDLEFAEKEAQPLEARLRIEQNLLRHLLVRKE
ncbi:MAG: 30S ribosomal protein S6 [Candidatus Gottesmanbacteria bacterium]